MVYVPIIQLLKSISTTAAAKWKQLWVYGVVIIGATSLPNVHVHAFFRLPGFGHCWLVSDPQFLCYVTGQVSLKVPLDTRQSCTLFRVYIPVVYSFWQGCHCSCHWKPCLEGLQSSSHFCVATLCFRPGPRYSCHWKSLCKSFFFSLLWLSIDLYSD